MKISGAASVVKSLQAEGVEVLFGYPGGANLLLYDALIQSGIRQVLVRNEQGAAHAASGYSRVTGKTGVCMATSGPGATNLVTGIATAYMDSIPLVAITGQVATDLIGRDVFQEVDITGATEPFTKNNYLVKDIHDLPRTIKEAFHIASTGRPGPVLIDIPKDVQTALIDFSYPESVDLRGYKPTVKGHPRQIKKAIQAMLDSQRPMIVVGGGGVIADATEELVVFAERMQAPVATTLMGIGAFPTNHPLSLGMLGGDHGVYPAKQAVADADFLVVMGSRMADRSTGKREHFAQKAKTVVHIDVDPAEIGKNIDIHIPIVGDIKKTLQGLLAQDFHKENPEWLQQIGEWKQVIRGTGAGSGDNGLDPMQVIRTLSSKTTKDTIITTDVGQHQIWTGRYYGFEQPRTFLTSGGLGTMGYGLPAAIGAKVGRPDKQVILITGDGSFQMNLTELATAAQEGLAVKIVLMNNSCLGMVRELQEHFCEKRYTQTTLKGNPDFGKLAEAYGFPAIRVDRYEDLETSIDQLLAHDGTMLAEFIIDPISNVIPVQQS
ncbi:MAG: biosynthetic-type acetolactate synthase large subunit [Bacillota bacterium]|nr:biosynthetic-type acetolactate synthase large subunit [Bacillota bacterium]MDW7676206.1 biosynthetic-type acetolactate synthase large subunit [Bacillota bacterium]